MSPRLDTNLAASDHVVVATLLGLGAPPIAWSGRIATTQTATWQVVDSLKAPASGALRGEITVVHPVVGGSPTANVGTPGLSPTLFTPGRRFVLFLKVEGDGLHCIDERDGALEASDALLAALRAR